MIQAYRVDGQVELEVESPSAFETALLASTSCHGIGIAKRPAMNGGFARYRLSKPDEGRFSAYLCVVFRRWPRHQHEGRVRAELRKMRGDVFCCKSTERQVNLNAPYDSAAKVRCGLHAGTHNWLNPLCDQE